VLDSDGCCAEEGQTDHRQKDQHFKAQRKYRTSKKADDSERHGRLPWLADGRDSLRLDVNLTLRCLGLPQDNVKLIFHCN